MNKVCTKRTIVTLLCVLILLVTAASCSSGHKNESTGLALEGQNLGYVSASFNYDVSIADLSGSKEDQLNTLLTGEAAIVEEGYGKYRLTFKNLSFSSVRGNEFYNYDSIKDSHVINSEHYNDKNEYPWYVAVDSLMMPDFEIAVDDDGMIRYVTGYDNLDAVIQEKIEKLDETAGEKVLEFRRKYIGEDFLTYLFWRVVGCVPNGPVEKGASWTYECDAMLPFNMTCNLNESYTLESIGNTGYKINMTGDIKTDPVLYSTEIYGSEDSKTHVLSGYSQGTITIDVNNMNARNAEYNNNVSGIFSVTRDGDANDRNINIIRNLKVSIN